MVEQEIHIMDVMNLLQLCDAIISIRIEISGKLLQQRVESVTQNHYSGSEGKSRIQRNIKIIYLKRWPVSEYAFLWIRHQNVKVYSIDLKSETLGEKIFYQKVALTPWIMILLRE